VARTTKVSAQTVEVRHYGTLFWKTRIYRQGTNLIALAHIRVYRSACRLWMALELSPEVTPLLATSHAPSCASADRQTVGIATAVSGSQLHLIAGLGAPVLNGPPSAPTPEGEIP
jgi:hypothetical protein